MTEKKEILQLLKNIEILLVVPGLFLFFGGCPGSSSVPDISYTNLIDIRSGVRLQTPVLPRPSHLQSNFREPWRVAENQYFIFSHGLVFPGINGQIESLVLLGYYDLLPGGLLKASYLVFEGNPRPLNSYSKHFIENRSDCPESFIQLPTPRADLEELGGTWEYDPTTLTLKVRGRFEKVPLEFHWVWSEKSGLFRLQGPTTDVEAFLPVENSSTSNLTYSSGGLPLGLSLGFGFVSNFVNTHENIPLRLDHFRDSYSGEIFQSNSLFKPNHWHHYTDSFSPNLFMTDPENPSIGGWTFDPAGPNDKTGTLAHWSLLFNAVDHSRLFYFYNGGHDFNNGRNKIPRGCYIDQGHTRAFIAVPNLENQRVMEGAVFIELSHEPKQPVLSVGYWKYK